MILELLTTCDFADFYQDKLLIVGASNKFHVSTKAPVRGLNFFIVYRIRFRPDEDCSHNLKVSVIDQEGKEVVPMPSHRITIDADSADWRSHWGVIPVIAGFRAFGEYSVEISFGEKNLGSQPFYVLPAGNQ